MTGDRYFAPWVIQGLGAFILLVQLTVGVFSANVSAVLVGAGVTLVAGGSVGVLTRNRSTGAEEDQ